MTTAMMKAKPKTRPLNPYVELPEPLPMTADEALEAITKMNRYVLDWSRSLLEFSQRQGWRALGYASLRDCLSAKLRVGAEASMCVLRAAEVREELAGLTGDQRLRERIWAMADSHTRILERMEKPGDRLKAYKRAVGHDRSGRVTAHTLSGTVKSMAGCKATVRRPRRERCPSCGGTGFVAQGRVVAAVA